MKEHTQKHISLLGATVQVQRQELQQQKQEFDKKLEEQQQALKLKLNEQKQEFEQKLQEKEQRIENTVTTLKEQHETDINKLYMAVGIPPYNITYSNYEQTKARRDGHINSPPIYTHPRGYKFELRLYPHGEGDGKGGDVSVIVASLKGDYI